MCRGRAELLEAYELLRKGAPALDDAAGAPVAPGRFRDAHRVEAMMRVEAPILDREECVDHQRRDPLERHVDPLLHEEREHLPVLPVEDDRALVGRAEWAKRYPPAALPQTPHLPHRTGRDADPQAIHPRSARVMISTRAPGAASATLMGVIDVFAPKAVRHSAIAAAAASWSVT